MQTGAGLYLVAYGCPKLEEVDLTRCEQLTDNDALLYARGGADRADVAAEKARRKLAAARQVCARVGAPPPPQLYSP